MIHLRAAPAGPINALGALIVAVFRLNGRALAAGDALTRDLGLTSARWQVMGAIALTGAPLPVAHIARNMGLTRQSVQRIVDELVEDKFVFFNDNPNHRRAKLVGLTASGRKAFDMAMRRQARWAQQTATKAGLSDRQLREVASGLSALSRALEG